MTSAGAAWVTHAAWDEASTFFNLITHDDHGSSYILARSDGRVWSERVVRAGQGDRLSFADDASYFLTHNGFVGTRRRVDQTRQINAIMLDIDCHGDDFADTVTALGARLDEAFACGFLPRPTMLVNSGRGYHAYYVLDRATPFRVKGGGYNQRGVKFVGDVTRNLSALYQMAIDDVEGAEVDRCVYDLARVARVPGSYNPAARQRCALVFSDGGYWSLRDLVRYRSLAPSPAQARCANASPTGVSTASTAATPGGTSGRRAPRGMLITFDRVLVSRLRKVRDLQEYRHFSCVGSRDNLCFVFYNTATQIYGPARARQLLGAFNARFVAPLPDKDLDQIARTVDNVVIKYGVHAGERGFYPLSAQTVVEKLGLTADEVEALRFFDSKRREDRAAARLQTRRRREARNAKIIELYESGSMTQAAVAKAVGCSLRTVSSVLNDPDLGRSLAPAPTPGERESQLPAAMEAASATDQAATRASGAPQAPATGAISPRYANFWHTGCCVEKPLSFFRSGQAASGGLATEFWSECSDWVREEGTHDVDLRSRVGVVGANV